MVAGTRKFEKLWLLMWFNRSAQNDNLVTSGLTSIILIVLGTVNHQFQGSFVSISLRSILRILAAHGYSLLIMLTSPLGVLAFIRPLTGYGSEYYLCAVLC